MEIEEIKPIILNLVLFSNNNQYPKMYHITRNFYKEQGIHTIYYFFEPTLTEEFVLDDDLLMIKGEESFIPGILTKTIKAIEYVKNKFYFDYLVRSNISTLIDFTKLRQKLLEKPNFHYGGGHLIRLGWLDPKSGITDNSLNGLQFASGTNIIMSSTFVDMLISNKDKICYNYIDDIGIAKFAEDFKIAPEAICDDNQFIYVGEKINPEKGTFNIFYYNKIYTNPYVFFLREIRCEASLKNLHQIFFRNNTSNRENDVENMKILASTLLSENSSLKFSMIMDNIFS